MSIKKTKSGAYHVRVQVGKRRVSRTVRTLKEAKEVEAKLKNDLHEMEHNIYMGRAPQCTYGQACIKWGKSGAPESMHSHIRKTLEYLQNTQLVDVPMAAENMKEVMLAQGLSNQTINRRLACIKRVLNLAYRKWGLLDFPIAEKIEKLSEANCAREIYLTPEEVQQLLDACYNNEARNFIHLAAYTGMRRSELFRATARDFRDGFLRITKSKSGKARTVPIPKFLWSVCESLPFKLSEHQLRNNIEKAREMIGQPDLRLHDIRHSYGSWLIKKTDAATVRDFLGHSSLAVTSKYTHSMGVDIDEIFKQG